MTQVAAEPIHSAFDLNPKRPGPAEEEHVRHLCTARAGPSTRNCAGGVSRTSGRVPIPL